MGRFDQARCVCEPGVLLGQLVPPGGGDVQRLELPHLPLELLPLGCESRGIGFEGDATFVPLLPRALELPHFSGGFL